MSHHRIVVHTRREAALARLSPRLRQAYEQHVVSATEIGKHIKRACWNIDYERQPVSFTRFIKDDFYLGRTLGRSLSPKLIADGEEFFSGGWVEAVLTGAVGYGKSTWAVSTMLYDIYRMSCLHDPAGAYGMTPSTEFGFVNVSTTLRQAKGGFFKRLYEIAARSPYFSSAFPYNRRIKSCLEFPKGLRAYSVVSNVQAALGDNVFCACFDEVNFWPIVERSRRHVPGGDSTYDAVAAVYNKMHQRLRSRLNQLGKVPGHIFLLSSCRYPNDFTERKLEQAREEAVRGEHFIFTRRYALWETSPPGKFMPETFRVEVGDHYRRSRVLSGQEVDVNQDNVIEVPVDLARDFQRDPDGCVRDFAGISTLSIRPFIHRREKIERMFALGEAAGLQHPFSAQDVTLQQPDPTVERLLGEHLHWVTRPKRGSYGCEIVGRDGRVVMDKVLFPALYFAHVDLSKSADASGLVVAHPIGYRKLMRFEPSQMKHIEESKPVIRVDLVLRIVAPRGGEIDVPRIRDIIYELSSFGMEFGRISFDAFGSQESIKSMKDLGFSAELFSTDRDMSAYEQLRSALYDERLLCYRVPRLQHELSQLEFTGQRVDHPATCDGSKDLCDGLAGVVHHIEDSWSGGMGMQDPFLFKEICGTNDAQQELDAISRRIAKGEAVSEQEIDKWLFGVDGMPPEEP